eukprot:2013696-Prymnesium_polylepis.1
MPWAPPGCVRVQGRVLVCKCEPPCPRVTLRSEKDIEEVECGAVVQAVLQSAESHKSCTRGAAPAASPSPVP